LQPSFNAYIVNGTLHTKIKTDNEIETEIVHSKLIVYNFRVMSAHTVQSVGKTTFTKRFLWYFSKLPFVQIPKVKSHTNFLLITFVLTLQPFVEIFLISCEINDCRSYCSLVGRHLATIRYNVDQILLLNL